MNAKILIVDDNEPAAQMLKLVLSSEDYRTRVVNDGPNAIRMAKEWKPDLILLDVMMPQLNGYEVCRRIRHIDQLSGVPIILLTAKSTSEDKISGFEAGADDYITKPFDNKELKLRVAARLKPIQSVVEQERYMPGLEIAVPLTLNKPRSGIFRQSFQVTKRIFDIAACLLTAPMVLVVLAATAIAVRIDSPGSVVFTQKRAGLNGRQFKMYKFRTMVHNATELKIKYADLNELTWPDFKITNDPRVTRVGKILRKTSLDELPQLWNVLIGDMSLVGPRPTSFAAKTYELWQTERLEILPGMTGLWQIKGRGDIDFHERVELDIEYLERQSWRLDLEILFQTVTAVIKGRGAH